MGTDRQRDAHEILAEMRRLIAESEALLPEDDVIPCALSKIAAVFADGTAGTTLAKIERLADAFEAESEADAATGRIRSRRARPPLRPVFRDVAQKQAVLEALKVMADEDEDHAFSRLADEVVEMSTGGFYDPDMLTLCFAGLSALPPGEVEIAGLLLAALIAGPEAVDVWIRAVREAIDAAFRERVGPSLYSRGERRRRPW